MRAVRDPGVVASRAFGAEPAALEQRTDDVAAVPDDVHRLCGWIGAQRSGEDEARLRGLLDTAQVARETEATHDVERPPNARRRLCSGAAPARNRRLERLHLAEVDQAGLRAERTAEKRRARARRAYDENQPCLRFRDGRSACAPEHAGGARSVERGRPGRAGDVDPPTDGR
jgi:hypothetical protein